MFLKYIIEDNSVAYESESGQSQKVQREPVKNEHDVMEGKRNSGEKVGKDSGGKFI